MTKHDKKNIWNLAIGSLIPVIFAAALFSSGQNSTMWNGNGLVFILIGGIAAMFMSYSGRDIRRALSDAFRNDTLSIEFHASRLIWHSAARNFWIMGVLGSLISFIVALSISEGGIAGITSRMARSMLPAIYGLILSATCSAPGLKLKLQDDDPDKPPSSDAAPEPRAGKVIGAVLFAAALGWMIILPLIWSKAEGPLPPIATFFHVPAILVVVGGTIALTLFIGRPSSGVLTWSFALAGFIGIMAGFLQAFLGFASGTIQDVAGGITFALAACLLSLLGMVAIGMPMEDRAMMTGSRKHTAPLSGTIGWVFPLITLIVLIITFFMVITPMEKVG